MVIMVTTNYTFSKIFRLLSSSVASIIYRNIPRIGMVNIYRELEVD